MPLQTPTATNPPLSGLTSAQIDAWDDRGATLLDPVTKSSYSIPVIYNEDNICGDPAYIVFGHAIGLNELIDCDPTQQATFSEKGRVPITGTTDATELNNLQDVMRDRLAAALIAFI
jgi:hypothetical protein